MGKAKFTLDCVDAKALFYALQELDFNPYYEDESLPNSDLCFSVSRVAMDSMGGIVGNETYTGILQMLHFSDFGKHGITPDSKHFVVPGSLDVYNIECPEEQWYNEDKDNYGEFGNIGEGYYLPDNDFVYQELKNALNLALESLPKGYFDSDKHGKRWIIESKDGTVLDVQWIEKAE